MRVIAGNLRGRTFLSPSGNRTHPMSDKMRGALFNVLGDISGLSVLDAFAGSGALGFEAISHDAARVTALDKDRNAQQTIAANIMGLGLSDRVKLVKAAASAWLSTTHEEFDIVLCDPPYEDLQLALLSKLAARAKPGGVVVFSLPPTARIDLPANYELLAGKDYGDGQLVFYRRIS